MIRRPPRSTQSRSSAASDVYKRQIRDRADGNAFTYRLRLGYQSKTACRVSVGMNSQVFYGQDEVAISDNFCDTMIPLALENSTGATLCPAQPSEYRCREILATTGTVCYWYKDTCNYIEEMQGVAREFAYGSSFIAVSYTHLRAHETVLDLVCRLLLEKKKKQIPKYR
eukprot:TRINITY_DN3557_c0_g1_i1.p1 TRINITY_DN3557_c0_g1~~TRINITY_DN3557_c0_g1_i1.p1  ORF type:complete len:169 (+),score=64.00 TRINITY_DN3557_c0_g1_i1:117-623(+)